jgi:hypothetical protein
MILQHFTRVHRVPFSSLQFNVRQHQISDHIMYILASLQRTSHLFHCVLPSCGRCDLRLAAQLVSMAADMPLN